ncbi:MAG: hypothetical protein ACODAU_09530 [Myxococcota bacterium]
MRQRWFTAAAMAGVLWGLLAPVARADRVVVLSPQGEEAPPVRLEAVEEALFEAIRAAGHEPVTERMAWEAPDAPPPETANELRAVAEVQEAEWALVPRVRPAEGGYWLTLRAGYAPETRVEEVTAEVRASRERDRLAEILAVLLRPEGLAGEGDRVEGEDRIGRAAEAEARTAEAEAQAAENERMKREQRARREHAERERRRAEEERQRREAAAQDRWDERERYGETAPWLVQAGLGMRPIVSHEAGAQGGVLGAVELRGGRSFEAAPGLEARAGMDLVFGASTAFALHVGAAYLPAFFPEVPVFIGASLELGWLQTLTGDTRASFLLRGAPTVAWRFADDWFLEGAVLEVMWLSAGGGAVTLGASARLGLRF